MRIDFEGILNFGGYVLVGLAKTIGIFFVMSILTLFLNYIFLHFEVSILGDAGYLWLFPIYLVIISFYGLIINSILYFYRLKLAENKIFVFFLHALSVPISVGIMKTYCANHLCYI